MKSFLFKPLIVLSTLLIIVSCSKDDDTYESLETLSVEVIGEIEAKTTLQDNSGAHEHNFSGLRVDGFTEAFESGSKGSYAGANVTLASGSWYLTDALLGSLSNDRKYGSKSMRIRNSGYAIMNFNMDNGADIVRVRHAKYGSNGTSTWRLIASYDNGANWYYVGDTVTTNSTTLNTVTFTVNTTSAVRFGIMKLSGGSNRINIDNFEITTSSGGGNGGGGTAARDSNITFGNPSNANTSSNNYYLSKPDFILSYNNSRGTANWVSWHLSDAWRGNADRCDCFKGDYSLPSSFYKPTTGDYTGTGFNRGHLCPSADRTYTDGANENTFYMSNIAPQSPDNNQQTWANFENYLRSLTDEGKEIHIISGVHGSGGTGSNGYAATIDSGQITVPDTFWKVALILDNGTDDINRVTTSTRVIAINVPNDQGVNSNWAQYRTTVNAIENLTGYDLLENIPNSIEAVLESNVDNGPTS